MRATMSPGLLFAILLIPFLLAPGLFGGDRELILGLVSYRDETASNPRELLIDYLKTHGIRLYPRAVTGSYDDIFAWLRGGDIQLAIVTPGVLLALKHQGVHPRILGCIKSPGKNGSFSHYRSVAVVPRDSPIQRVEDLNGRRLIFVNELSMSGYLGPASFLRYRGVSVHDNRIFSDSHTLSLKWLTEGKGDAAFVYEAAVANLPPAEGSKFKTLSLILDEKGHPFEYPNDFFIALPQVDQNLTEKIATALLALENDRFSSRLQGAGAELIGFSPTEPELFDRQLSLLENLLPPPTYRYTLPQMVGKIGRHIRKMKIGDPTFSPRIALVLSGGGAKNSFQAGIIADLEGHLARAGLDLHFIVGTSVGAFNGLMAAIGEGHNLREFWKHLTLEQVWQNPPTDLLPFQWRVSAMRLLFRYPLESLLLLSGAASLGLLNIYFFAAMILRNLGLGFFGFFIAQGLWSLILLALFPLHFNLFLQPISWGFLVFYLFYKRSLDSGFFESRKGWRRAFLLLNLLILQFIIFLILLLGNMIFQDRTFVSGFPFESYIAHILNWKLSSGGQVPFSPPGKLIPEKIIEDISARVLAGKTIRRNYIISATDYRRQKECFFYHAVDPETEKRCRALGFFSLAADCQSPITSVMAASAGFFPFMNHQEIKMAKIDPDGLIGARGGGGLLRLLPFFPTTLENTNTMQLVDGGFFHNNPIRAAVDLGATHIIAINSSPRVQERQIGATFIENIFGIIDLLFNRTQAEDFEATAEIPTYLIAPRPEDTKKHLTVYDFDGKYRPEGLSVHKQPAVTILDNVKYGVDLAYDRNWGFEELSRGRMVLPPVSPEGMATQAGAGSLSK